MARRSAARPRSSADARRAQPVALLQPEHPSARRSAGALRRRPRAARACGAAGVAQPSAVAFCREIARQICAGRRPLRAIDALPSLHARLLLAGADRRAHRRTIRSRRVRDAVAGALAAAARLLADDERPRAAHRRRRWRDADADRGPRPRRLARQPGGRRGAPRRPDLRGRPHAGGAVWLLGHPARSRRCAVAQRPVANDALSAALPDTGYFVSRSPAGDHLVIDGGPHGYQNGGHAHADALSLTLSRARRAAAHRPRHRLATPSTRPARSHAIDARCTTRSSSTDARSRCRAARFTGRTSRRHACIAGARTPSFDYFDGAHDGYSPLEHRRRVLVLHGDLCVVADLVNGSGAHTAAVHWHLDPRWTVETRARGAVFTRGAERDRPGRCSVPEGLIETFVGDDRTGLGMVLVRVRPARAHDDHPHACAAAAPYLDGQRVRSRPQQPVADVAWVPVWAEAGAVAHATAIASRERPLWIMCCSPNPLLDDALAGPRRTRCGRASVAGRRRRDGRAHALDRTTSDQAVACMGLVDGSVARAAGSQGIDVTLPQPRPRFFSVTRPNSEQRATNEDRPRIINYVRHRRLRRSLRPLRRRAPPTRAVRSCTACAT